MEKISVLMSLYYKEKPSFLHACLESLAQQTITADEIVIVLDGPIPNPLMDIIIEWQYKLPLKIVPLSENVGLGKALNIGLQNCSHRLIARMDTDDYAAPYRFEEQLKEFLLNPKLVLVGGNIEELNIDLQEKMSNKKVPLSLYEIKKFSVKRNPFNHMTVMFDKYKIIAAGGYIDHPLMEDYNLWLRCLALNYEMLNIHSSLVSVRAGKEMVARRKGLIYLKSEYYLFTLKNALKTDKYFTNLKVFILRSTLRLLPTSLLKLIYKLR